ncbi:MAG: cold-shock protein [Planctomycetes bacterium]|jgi:CspA family cold shock protein|nr:cold-shock protein [Planctomycetota bacterium]MCL4731999.1 cold shock domain-containing protein [Planctomycetota bacterium]
MATSRIKTRGTVKWFDTRKGFGFAQRPGAPPVFIHIGAIRSDGVVDLKPGQELEFIIEITRRGPVAHDIHVI